MCWRYDIQYFTYYCVQFYFYWPQKIVIIPIRVFDLSSGNKFLFFFLAFGRVSLPSFPIALLIFAIHKQCTWICMSFIFLKMNWWRKWKFYDVHQATNGGFWIHAVNWKCATHVATHSNGLKIRSVNWQENTSIFPIKKHSDCWKI